MVQHEKQYKTIQNKRNKPLKKCGLPRLENTAKTILKQFDLSCSKKTSVRAEWATLLK